MEKMKHDLDKEPVLAAEVIRLLERVQRLESVAEALEDAEAKARQLESDIQDIEKNTDYLADRCRQLEAESAAMRAALGEALKTPNEWWCPACERAVDGSEVTFEDYHEICGTYLGEVNSPGWITKVQMAIAPDAGKALLERVQRLEAVAEAAKAIGDELGDCQCGNAWCTKARVLKQALNALEGGAGDAK